MGTRIQKGLIIEIDQFLKKNPDKYPSRMQFIADAIREKLKRHESGTDLNLINAKMDLVLATFDMMKKEKQKEINKKAKTVRKIMKKSK